MSDGLAHVTTPSSSVTITTSLRPLTIACAHASSWRPTASTGDRCGSRSSVTSRPADTKLWARTRTTPPSACRRVTGVVATPSPARAASSRARACGSVSAPTRVHGSAPTTTSASWPNSRTKAALTRTTRRSPAGERSVITSASARWSSTSASSSGGSARVRRPLAPCPSPTGVLLNVVRDSSPTLVHRRPARRRSPLPTRRPVSRAMRSPGDHRYAERRETRRDANARHCIPRANSRP